MKTINAGLILTGMICYYIGVYSYYKGDIQEAIYSLLLAVINFLIVKLDE